MSRFKYSVNTNGLRKKYSTQDIVTMLAKLEADGIEWGLPAYDEAGKAIREMAACTRDAGLEVMGYINGPKLWKKDDMRRWADLVHAVGGTSLRVAHPWIAWDYREALHLKENWHDIFNLAHDAMPDVAATTTSGGQP